MTPERCHGVDDAQEGCRAGQFSADTLVKRNREIMSIHREASQRAGKIMSRAECKVMIVQTVKKRQPEYNFRVERVEEDVGSLEPSGAGVSRNTIKLVRAVVNNFGIKGGRLESGGVSCVPAVAHPLTLTSN